MSNDVVIKSGKTLRLGDNELTIGNNEAPVIFHDLVVEHRHVNGVVYISLASIAADAGNPAEVTVVSRHRMSLVAAQVLRNMLTDLIDDATKPVDQSKAN